MGLHVQHGGQCDLWCGAKRDVELFQLASLQKEQDGVGCMAGSCRGVGALCYESGVAGLPSDLGGAGCAQPVAFGDHCPHGAVLQVSFFLPGFVPRRNVDETNTGDSFLVRDAKDDIGTNRRLKA